MPAAASQNTINELWALHVGSVFHGAADTERRLCPKKHKICVSLYTQTHSLTHTHIHAHTLHNLCTQFNLFEPSCLLCHGYNTNTSPGRFQDCEQQTHLPLIPWLKALQPVRPAPDGCFDKCCSLREPMSCTLV